MESLDLLVPLHLAPLLSVVVLTQAIRTAKTKIQLNTAQEMQNVFSLLVGLFGALVPKQMLVTYLIAMLQEHG